MKPKLKDPPLLIWLQGGPGSSSMIGLFYENGPFRVNENMKLERQPFSWTDEYSVLFIDQLKFDQELQEDQKKEQAFFKRLAALDSSRMKSMDKSAASFENRIRTRAARYSNGYVKDQRGVASDLLVFLDQFYQRYPEVQNKELYLSGESYAGKYVPALAYGIMKVNEERCHHRDEGDGNDDGDNRDEVDDEIRVDVQAKFIFPLKGIIMGNSLTDPVSQIQVHADHAYFLGLLTRAQADEMRALQDKASQEAEIGQFLVSNSYRLELFELFKNATGGLNWFDIRKGSIPNDWSRMESFMNEGHIKEALNIFGPRTAYLEEQGVSPEEIHRVQEGRSKTHFYKDPFVAKAMEGDIMRSAAWMVSRLLQQGIKVLLHQGIFDFRDAVAGSNAWIEQLEWPGQGEFLKTEREIWVHEGKLAGYVIKVPGLSRVVLLGAGHLVPMDQGENALAMIKSFMESL
ncbi:hypothetical protein BGZ65_007467 [Modicella reniformis]|uniref:Carboxypeptidase n=1 Tax=Modicella reniformis TaxID=1440133 RepID=A0A9P6SSJ4_9FUNG|nr:hypothetical protein BGZ65_007467 [Modicella reniformis]